MNVEGVCWIGEDDSRKFRCSGVSRYDVFDFLQWIDPLVKARGCELVAEMLVRERESIIKFECKMDHLRQIETLKNEHVLTMLSMKFVFFVMNMTNIEVVDKFFLYGM